MSHGNAMTIMLIQEDKDFLVSKERDRMYGRGRQNVVAKGTREETGSWKNEK